MRLAADVAARFGVELELFGAVADPHEVAQHEAYLGSVAARVQAHQHGVATSATVVVNPHGPDAIAAYVNDTMLPVMATSARPYLHHGYIGSAAEHVVRTTQRPVMFTAKALSKKARALP